MKVNERKLEFKSQEKQAATTFLRKLTSFNLVINANPRLTLQTSKLAFRKNTSNNMNMEESTYKINEIDIKKINIKAPHQNLSLIFLYHQIFLLY